jgi:hypothetical protein
MADYTVEQYRAAAQRARDAGNLKAAEELARAGMRLQQQSTSRSEQAGAGITEGLAGVFGAPSDLANASTDLITRGINRVTGLDLKTSQDLEEKTGPLLGTSGRYVQDAQTLGVMTDVPPQTEGQTFWRDAGREFGAGVPFAAMAAPYGMARTAIAEIGSALGGATAGKLTENLPEPVQQIARLLGNFAGATPALMTAPRAQGPSYDDVDGLARQSWEDVAGSDVRLTQQGRDDLIARLDSRFRTGKLSERVSERNTPKAASALDDVTTLPPDPHIYGDIVDYRRAVGRDVAGATDPAERLRGVQMKREIDDYLRNLQPQQATGTDVPGTVEALDVANNATRRVSNADMITDQLDKAGRRAARSGRGGNTVNTIRQNIDKILNTQNMRAGFSEDDLRVMDEIVNGTTPINTLRHLSGLAPSTGVLPAMGNLAAGSAAAYTGNPLFMLPGIVGEGARFAADTMTQKQVRDLLAQVLNGAPLPKADDPRRAIISALMAGQAGYANTPQDSQGPR